MKKPALTPSSPAAAPDRDEPLAEIEVMIARLRKLKDHERDTRLPRAYLASIERLEGLSYRLRVKPETRVIGLPVKQTIRRPGTAATHPATRAGAGEDREGEKAETTLSRPWPVHYLLSSLRPLISSDSWTKAESLR